MASRVCSGNPATVRPDQRTPATTRCAGFGARKTWRFAFFVDGIVLGLRFRGTAILPRTARDLQQCPVGQRTLQGRCLAPVRAQPSVALWVTLERSSELSTSVLSLSVLPIASTCACRFRVAARARLDALRIAFVGAAAVSGEGAALAVGEFGFLEFGHAAAPAGVQREIIGGGRAVHASTSPAGTSASRPRPSHRRSDRAQHDRDAELRHLVQPACGRATRQAGLRQDGSSDGLRHAVVLGAEHRMRSHLRQTGIGNQIPCKVLSQHHRQTAPIRGRRWQRDRLCSRLQQERSARCSVLMTQFIFPPIKSRH